MRLSKVVILVISLLAIWACKRTKNEGVLGPHIITASNNFAILDTFHVAYSVKKKDTSLVRFYNYNPLDTTYTPSTTYFNATFNEKVSWNINIRYFSKNANINRLIGSRQKGIPEKNINNTSNKIDITNSTWDGKSENGFYFTDKDSVIATLNVWGSEVIRRDTFQIGIRPEANDTTQYFLLNDFEGFFSQVVYGDNKDIIPNPLPVVSTAILPPQGSRSLVMTATDHNGDYFTGGFKINLPENIFRGRAASDIYINMYVFGFPNNGTFTPSATRLGVGISEDDVNKNKEFDQLFEDTFDQQITVDWVGWKLVTVKYSNLKRATVLTEGGNGNNKIEPERAFSVNFNLLANPNGSTVGTAVDYVIITYGKPYER